MRALVLVQKIGYTFIPLFEMNRAAGTAAGLGSRGPVQTHGGV